MTKRAKKTATEKITPAAYARRRGISRQAVSQAIAAGRISTIDGRIDPDVADREFRANTDQSKPRNSVTGRPKGKDPKARKLAARVAKAEREVQDLIDQSYAASRARRESWAEKTAELEYHEKAGSLVAIADVAADWEDRITRAKNATLDARRQFVPAVLSAKDVPAAEAALQGLLDVFFSTISQGVDDEEAPRKKGRRRAV